MVMVVLKVTEVGRTSGQEGRIYRIGRGGGAVCLFECGAVYICQWAAGAQPGESGRNAVSACNAPSSCPAAITVLGFRDALLGIFSFFLSPCAMRVCLVLADDSSPAWDSASELWGLFPLGAPGGVQGIT